MGTLQIRYIGVSRLLMYSDPNKWERSHLSSACQMSRVVDLTINHRNQEPMISVFD